MADKDLHCGCTSYRKATLVIGIVQLVCTIVGMIYVNTAINTFIEADAANEDEVQILKTLIIIVNCSLLLAMGITILLIIGALQRNQCLLMPFLIMAWISAPLGALHVVRRLFNLSPETALDTMLMLANCAFSFYCLVVVTKYNNVLKEANKFNAPRCGTISAA